ncbi:uncharacterized protein LOC133352444 [Lethenteron reissneri]|uniref:uncharacterized protein LOC133352444 n=1 Tax=Lethenteron reissneri TaxID=7753 RepID=UPI002AB5E9C6|nr:uncharacterized protein LOC133352444 [Lethenteron reissneri]XP_061424077.1 uncharacterized protein LOC133352444 [Lethenteron reissneri]
MRALLGGQVTLVSALICAHLKLTSLCPTGERWSDPPAALATAPLGAAWGGALEVTWGRPPRASLPITWYQVWAHGDHVASVNATAPGDDSGSERLRVELSGLEPNTTYSIEVFPVSVSGSCVSQGPAASINVTLASSTRVDSRGLLNCNGTCLSEDARTALIVVPLVIGIPTVVLVALVLWKGCSRWDPPGGGTGGDGAQLKNVQGPPSTPGRPGGTLGSSTGEQTRATWTPPDKTAG